MCHTQHVRSALHERSSKAPSKLHCQIISDQFYDMLGKYRQSNPKSATVHCDPTGRITTEPRILCVNVTCTARHGPHVTQVQAALRCAEGTYSCCRVLLSVFQIRSLPSCAQRARNCCDFGLKAQGSAARPPSAAILAVRVCPSASRETRVRENCKVHMRSCTGATKTLIGPPGFCGRAIVFNQPQTDAEVSYSIFAMEFVMEVELSLLSSSNAILFAFYN